MTLHLAAADDYPAYAQLVRAVAHAHVAQAFRASRRGAGDRRARRVCSREPRANAEIRERVWGYEGVTRRVVADLLRPRPAPARAAPARGVLGRPPPADVRRRPAAAARARRGCHARALPLPRRVRAASRRDVAAWSGVAQRDFTAAWQRLHTVEYRDEHGTALFDLPGQPLPPASMPLPPANARALGSAAARLRRPRAHHPDRGAAAQAHAQRRPDGDRRRPRGRELGARADGDAVRLTVTPHVEIRRAARAAIRAEAKRIARFCVPDARTVEVAGV